MPKVVVKENEQLDDALRRFKRQVSRSGENPLFLLYNYSNRRI